MEIVEIYVWECPISGFTTKSIFVKEKKKNQRRKEGKKEKGKRKEEKEEGRNKRLEERK